jgi:diacylglycerol kinase family enzyme
VNLRARRLARGDFVLTGLRTLAHPHDAWAVHETRSIDELDEAARTIARERPDVVVFAGGDGSYMAGLTALRRAYGADALPAIGLAPGGTVSTVARNHGMPLGRYALGRYTARLLHACADSPLPTRDVPTLTVADDEGGERTGFIFGAGLVARFFDLYEADGARGYAGAARIVARIFASSFVAGATARRVLAPTPARIALDGSPQPASAYSLVAAAAVRDLGLHMLVTYRAGEDPSRVHLVASPLGPCALGPQMPLVLAGKRLLGDGHVDALAREATIAFPEGTPYVLDGDVFYATAVTVRAGPAIRLIVTS